MTSKEQIQDKILKLNGEIKKIVGDLAEVISEWGGTGMTDKEFALYKKLRAAKKRLEDL
ncbi:MAG: hypothetical protein LBG21_04100 [Campylobacteraceae bacterium]|jgi:hypothetical protein|nr:hypothetical protein [Campylobacteraceae bacterium]